MAGGSGDDLDRETEDLLAMLDLPDEDGQPAASPAASPNEHDRGLTALLEGLDDAESGDPPARPESEPEPPPAAWPLVTESDARPPSMTGATQLPDAPVIRSRPKSNSETFPRIDSDPLPEAVGDPLADLLSEPVEAATVSLGKVPSLDPEPALAEPSGGLIDTLEPVSAPPAVSAQRPARATTPASPSSVKAATAATAALVAPPRAADDPDEAVAAAEAELTAADPLAALRAGSVKKPRTMLWVGIISFVAAGLAAVIYTQSDAFHPERDKTRAMVAEGERERALRDHRSKQPTEGSLIIDASEAEAAVWLKLGRTPLESLAVPSSQVHYVRYELEGFRPVDEAISRTHWVGEGGAQRAKQQIQLVKGTGSLPSFPPEPPVRPAPGPKGKGPMDLSSSPAGAEVWLLIGFTPEVKLTGVEVGHRYELKVLKDGFRPAFAAVTESDWMMGEREVRVSAKLAPRK